MTLLEVITVREEQLHRLHGEVFAGRHVPAPQLAHRVLLHHLQHVLVGEVTVEAGLEVVDVDGGGEEEDGGLDGTLADQGEGGQVQERLHLVLLTERGEVEVVLGLLPEPLLEVAVVEAESGKVRTVSRDRLESRHVDLVHMDQVEDGEMGSDLSEHKINLVRVELAALECNQFV